MIDLRLTNNVAVKPAHIFNPVIKHTPVFFVDPVFDKPYPLMRFMQLLLKQHELLGFLHVVKLVDFAMNNQVVALTL